VIKRNRQERTQPSLVTEIDKSMAGDSLTVAFLFVTPWIGGVLSGLAFRGQWKDWYDRLLKAPWNPPRWVFGPAWTILYLLMGWSSYEYYSMASATKFGWAMYFIQLLLNWAWSPLFFGARCVAWAFADIVLMCVFISLTMTSFFQASTLAGSLLIPYLAWVVYALSLNGYILFSN
jgi:tryptophan-rich sensory protein